MAVITHEEAGTLGKANDRGTERLGIVVGGILTLQKRNL